MRQAPLQRRSLGALCRDDEGASSLKAVVAMALLALMLGGTLLARRTGTTEGGCPHGGVCRSETRPLLSGDVVPVSIAGPR